MGMFGDAKTLKTASAKAKKPATPEIEIDGLEDVAALDAAIKSLTALKKAKEAGVKEGPMTAYFVSTGAAAKARPQNFRGTDGSATASCELRIRSSTSPLTDDEEGLMVAKGLPVEEVVEVAATYVINPAYLEDEVLLGKVEAALKKVSGIPQDFIMRQEGKSKKIVGEKALDELFANHSEAAIADLLPLVGVLAIKPTLADDDIMKAMDIVQRVINPPKAKKPAKA